MREAGWCWRCACRGSDCGDPVRERRKGKDALPLNGRVNATFAAAMSAPSLRQYELDQVQRVTAPRKPHSRISAPWRDTPGECSKLTVRGGFCQEPAFVCDVISSAEKIIYNFATRKRKRWRRAEGRSVRRAERVEKYRRSPGSSLFLGCGTPDFGNGRCDRLIGDCCPVSAVSRFVHGQKYNHKGMYEQKLSIWVLANFVGR